MFSLKYRLWNELSALIEMVLEVFLSKPMFVATASFDAIFSVPPERITRPLPSSLFLIAVSARPAAISTTAPLLIFNA